MSAVITIALDAMGGDHGADTVIPAAINILKHRDEISLVLVGDQALLEERLSQVGFKGNNDRMRIHHAAEIVGMDESPSRALRFKKDSSMRVAINLVKDGTAQACVSAGNTGALMATARYVLKTLPGIDRPAISSAIPSIEGFTEVLDLGANVDCSAEHLFQFAVMGSVLASAVHGLDKPRVGLLNIGEEEIKGNDQVKEAARLLAGSSLNYIGFVEGNDIFKGGVDVVVCDGFVGNVALKTSEGVAKMVSHFMREAFSRNLLTKLAGAIAMPVLKAFRSRIDPRRYNGASLLGLRGIVIKSHGGADAFAFENAINVAVLEVEKAVPDRIHHLLEDLLTERQTM
jgi:glycerol-3-phosphate acyltransferase PlsX